MKYGWYSERCKQEARNMGPRWRSLGLPDYVATVWRTENGEEVEVTGVTDDAEGARYQWSDRRAVGRVVEIVRDVY